jgi:hypothetical protein
MSRSTLTSGNDDSNSSTILAARCATPRKWSAWLPRLGKAVEAIVRDHPQGLAFTWEPGWRSGEYEAGSGTFHEIQCSVFDSCVEDGECHA